MLTLITTFLLLAVQPIALAAYTNIQPDIAYEAYWKYVPFAPPSNSVDLALALGYALPEYCPVCAYEPDHPARVAHELYIQQAVELSIANGDYQWVEGWRVVWVLGSRTIE